MRDVLKALGRSSIRVTDIAAQYWCERQMEYNYVYGRKVVTQAIRNGTAVHARLEDETNVPVQLSPKSYADVLYKILYTGMVELGALKRNGVAREIQAYGSISGFRVVGKIDQLELSNGQVTVLEDKTKSNGNEPSDAQLLTNRIQVMVYRKMLEDAAQGAYSPDAYARDYGISRMRITDGFSVQLDALGVPKSEQTLQSAAQSYFSSLRSMGSLSDSLRVRYINQATGSEIRTYEFKYDAAEMRDITDFVMAYWRGARDAMPVQEQDKWKCRFCQFYGKECKAWWPQGTL